MVLGWLALLSLGCNEGPEPAAKSSRRFVDAESFSASATPYREGALVLAGTKVPVSLTREEEDKIVSFRLAAHGQTIEIERYESDSAGIRILAAGGETYDPPIPLLRFPFEIGDAWQWKGRASSGSVVHLAEAKVGTSSEVLNVPGGPFDAVRVSAVMLFQGDDLRQATRTLDFWFVPGKGVFKRQFGTNSTREPAPAAISP